MIVKRSHQECTHKYDAHRCRINYHSGEKEISVRRSERRENLFQGERTEIGIRSGMLLVSASEDLTVYTAEMEMFSWSPKSIRVGLKPIEPGGRCWEKPRL